ncbi:TetR/AcrR family transcriptional regulator [Salana multivorans]
MTPRDRARERTLGEIRAIAWRHLEEQGAAALSLRAVARELGVVSSAIYRYVPSRDDLLTDLIVEGYEDLGAAAAAALAAVDAEGAEAAASPRERWLAVGRGVLEWARSRPAAWSLLYGSPVPGYHAPPERTTDAGVLVMGLLARVVADAVAAGQWHDPAAGRGMDPRLAPGMVTAAEELGVVGSAEAVAATAAGWALLISAVTSEIFEQLGVDVFGAPEAWAEHLLERSAAEAGLA